MNNLLHIRSPSMKATQKKKEYLKAYREINDAIFIWLENEFLPYLDNWKESIENRPRNFFPECSVEDVSTQADKD